MTVEIDFKNFFENYNLDSTENFKRLNLNDGLELQFGKALLLMAKKKQFEFLVSLKFREVENYLRPINHIPFIKNEDFENAEKVFTNTKLVILLDISYNFLTMKGHIPTISRVIFDTMTLVEKNIVIRELFIKLKILFNFINFELVYVENNAVYVKFDNEYDCKELFQSLVCRFFKEKSELLPINVLFVN